MRQEVDARHRVGDSGWMMHPLVTTQAPRKSRRLQSMLSAQSTKQRTRSLLQRNINADHERTTSPTPRR